MLYPTEDVLVDDTTVVHHQPSKRTKHFNLIDRTRQGDYDEGRDYGKFCVDTMKSGHKDTKNTALTVPMKEVHTLRHSTKNNRNQGDASRHMGLSQYNETRYARPAVDYYRGNAVVFDKREDTMMNTDMHSELNVMDADDFTHGGTRVDAIRATMMGAGQTVPVDNLDGTNLNNSYGLHYSIDIGPGKKIGAMQKKELMQRVSRQQDGPTDAVGPQAGTR
mgnify:CR=1 FL=1|tara:strand:+ start:286 stop:945 length:660 start_codon:yes stop_codon:yes gene_type:complete